MRTMWTVAILVLNLTALGVWLFFWIEETPSNNVEGTHLLVLCYIVINIIMLISLALGFRGNSWLGLHLKRKRLEEQKRIESLEKDIKPKDEQKQ